MTLTHCLDPHPCENCWCNALSDLQTRMDELAKRLEVLVTEATGDWQHDDWCQAVNLDVVVPGGCDCHVHTLATLAHGLGVCANIAAGGWA
jgi:hypothetical protein